MKKGEKFAISRSLDPWLFLFVKLYEVRLKDPEYDGQHHICTLYIE